MHASLFVRPIPLSFFTVTSSHGDGLVDEGDNHEGSQGAAAVLSGVWDAAAVVVDEVAAVEVAEAAGPETLEWEWVPWTRPKVQRNSPCLV